MDVSEVWRVYQTADEDANDSNKSFTVPDHTEWQVLWVWVELTTSAAVGARQLELRIEDAAGDVIGILGKAGVTQAASLTYNYLFAPCMPDATALRDGDFLSVVIPPTTFLDMGWVLRVFDNNAVAAAADDMIVQFQFAARSVLQ
jgi:hypothetical protein